MLITINKGLNNWSIEWIQDIEKALDVALVRQGYTRTTTTKADEYLLFNYKLFGKCLSEKD